MKKFIAFSDLHIHKFKQHNYLSPEERLNKTLSVLDDVFKLAQANDADILFCGDLFHQQKALPHSVLLRTYDLFSNWLKDSTTRFFAVSGQHDYEYKKMSYKDEAASILELFSKSFESFNLLDNLNYSCLRISIDSEAYAIDIYGVPFMYDIEAYKDAVNSLLIPAEERSFKILLTHCTMNGGKINNGVDDDFEGFNRFDLVLCGDIHKAHKYNNRLYMLGNPLQQNAHDEGEQNGIWLVSLPENYYDSAKMEFIPLCYPKFVSCSEQDKEQVIKEGNYPVIRSLETVTESINLQDSAVSQLDLKRLHLENFSTTNNLTADIVKKGLELI